MKNSNTAVMDSPSKYVCPDEPYTIEEQEQSQDVVDHITNKLMKFESDLAGTNVCSIEGIVLAGETVELSESEDGEKVPMTFDEDCILVKNHVLRTMYQVPVEKILKADDKKMEALLDSLVRGVFIKVEGVTRIVGYYSRISNWNKSKANIVDGKVGGELGDRMRGNYWTGLRRNSGMKSAKE